jgi:hypothetical protein
MDKVMLSLTNFSAEMEREKARQRTHEALRRKALAGHVAGGVVYGDRNVEVLGDAGQRAHVRREVDDAQAAVIRRTFEACAAGKGFVRIARSLNVARIPGPRGCSWAPTAIREMLHRELYRARVVWNKTKWVDRNGTKVKVNRPEREWIVTRMPWLCRSSLARCGTPPGHAGHRRALPTCRVPMASCGGGPSLASSPRISSPAGPSAASEARACTCARVRKATGNRTTGAVITTRAA